MAITIGNAVGLGSDYVVTTGVGAVDANTQRITIADFYPKAGNTTPILLASLNTSQQLKAANSSRIGLVLTNTDANSVYVNYGSAASSTAFVVAIPSGAYWEMPTPIYTGTLYATWAADGTGSLIGTELTP